MKNVARKKLTKTASAKRKTGKAATKPRKPASKTSPVRAVGAALQPWSVAVASVLVASGLARGSSWLGLELAVSWFYVATAVTAWLAGRAPGVFASILATALIEYLFIPAHGLT